MNLIPLVFFATAKKPVRDRMEPQVLFSMIPASGPQAQTLATVGNVIAAEDSVRRQNLAVEQTVTAVERAANSSEPITVEALRDLPALHEVLTPAILGRLNTAAKTVQIDLVYELLKEALDDRVLTAEQLGKYPTFNLKLTDVQRERLLSPKSSALVPGTLGNAKPGVKARS